MEVAAHIPYPVRLTFGAAAAFDRDRAGVRQAVQQLGVDAFQRRRRYMKPLHALLHQSGPAPSAALRHGRWTNAESFRLASR